MFVTTSSEQSTRRALGKTERRRLLAAGLVAVVVSSAALTWTYRSLPGDHSRHDRMVVASLNEWISQQCSPDDRFAVVQAGDHPPIGRALMVRSLATGKSAGPSPDCVADRMRGLDTTGLAAAAAPVAQADILLLFQPARPEMTGAIVEELGRFVDSRPAGDRVAVYLWQERIRQAIDFTTDRDRLDATLHQLADQRVAAAPEPAASARNQVQAVLEGMTPAGLSHRAVVMVRPRAPGDAPVEDSGESPVEYFWLDYDSATGQQRQTESGAPTAGGAASLGQKLSDVARSIDLAKQSTYFRVGYCVDAVKRIASLLDASGNQAGSTECDAHKLAAGRLRAAQQIELRLTSEARFIFSARSALSELGNRKATLRAKRGFVVDMVLDDEPRPVRANLSLRGAGTLECKRKSFRVEMPSGPPVGLFSNSQNTVFALLSLCKDANLITTHLGASIYRHFGLFPFQFRFVEVLLDGVSNGLYLMIEHPVGQVDRMAQPVGLLRRGYELEARGPFETGPDMIDRYNDTLRDLRRDDPARRASAWKSVGVERYLRWLALNSLLRNGDYVDELWLLATAAVTPSGDAGVDFETFAWDFDALFTDCHQMGKAALTDDRGLMYCAEADLDREILRNEELYALYADILEDTLDTLGNAEFLGFVDQTMVSIQPFVHNERLAEPTFRLDDRAPPPAGESTLQKAVNAASAILGEGFSARRQVLLENLSRYRSGEAATRPARKNRGQRENP